MCGVADIGAWPVAADDVPLFAAAPFLVVGCRGGCDLGYGTVDGSLEL
jgi:hypothetical protein